MFHSSLYFLNFWFPVNPLLEGKSWRFWDSWRQHLLLRQTLVTTGYWNVIHQEKLHLLVPL